MDLIAINLLDGAVTGLLLFMLTAGLTLIFSMMGVLNFAHASFYMLGAYFGYQISKMLAWWLGYDAGFFAAVIVAPIVVGLMGAAVERYGLRRVHRHGHVPELIFTFGLAFLIEELVEFFWGVNLMAFDLPPILDQTLFSIGPNAFPAYKVFMIVITVGVFLVLLGILRGTRVGLVIQAALSHPHMVEA
ncbi:MAG: branched-chain amino acid ABC transporter permease, partial [Pseudomonadota bacterium]